MDKTNIIYPSYRFVAAPRVTGIGRAKALAIHPDRVIDYWVLGIMTAGRMPVRIGDIAATLEPGQYFLLPPGVRHHGTERTPFDTVWMHFYADAQLVVSGNSTPDVLPIVGRVPADVNYLALVTMLKRSLDRGVMTLDEASIQVAAILGQLAAEDRVTRYQSADAQLAHRALDILISRFCQPPSCAEIADELGYSYGHVERCFRKVYGVTIRQKLTDIRMSEALAMIAHGVPLKDVADQAGYSDYYYFIRVFTRVVGRSPGKVASAIKQAAAH